MSSSPSSHTEESQQQQQQQQQSSPRYWCYTCNAEVPIYMAPDPTCQRCNDQFIEEIDSENDPRTFLAGAPAATTSITGDESQSGNDERAGDNQPHQAFFRYETGDDDDIFHFFAPMGGRPSTEGGIGSGGLGGTGDGGEPGNHNQQPLATMIQNLLTSMLGPAAEGMQQQQQQQQQQQRSGSDGENEDTTAGEDQQHPTSTTGEREEGNGETQSQRPRRPTPVVFYGSMTDGNMQFRPMNIPTQQNQGEGEEGQGGDENRPPNNFANLFQLLSTLIGSPEGGFVGNPDDYVFSQTALDNIISQLMEQTSGRNAPPPAPETVIDSLPKRKLTEEEIAQQIDCAVCKDEFEGTEQVTELPCTHVFHDDCIKPWLKVNGTCPVCRHSVIGEKEESSNTDHEENNTSPSSEQQSGQSGQSSNAQAPPSPSPQNNNNQTPDPASTLSSLLFEGARRIYNDRSPAATWHTTIPGPFTWGPGGRATNNPTTNNDNNNNNNNNDNNNSNGNNNNGNTSIGNSSNNNDANNNNNHNTQQQSSADPNNTDPMDLDLD